MNATGIATGSIRGVIYCVATLTILCFTSSCSRVPFPLVWGDSWLFEPRVFESFLGLIS